MKNKWYTKSKKIPALDWDWFENSSKKYEIEGMKYDDIRTIAHAKFRNGWEAVLDFVPPYIINGSKCKGYFTISLYDEFSDNIEEWGGYESLNDFEEFWFKISNKGVTENYIVRFARGKDYVQNRR
jgi:hypothetical protein